MNHRGILIVSKYLTCEVYIFKCCRSNNVWYIRRKEGWGYIPSKTFPLVGLHLYLPQLCQPHFMIFLKLFSKTMKEPFNLGILMVMISGLLGKSNCGGYSSFFFFFFSLLVGGVVCNCLLFVSNNFSYGFGQWSTANRTSYNLVDTLTRHTAQVTN